MYCSRCGTEVDNQARFCPSCGLDLATTTPLAAVQPDRSDESEFDVVRDALADEWEIQKELGRGGMAIVFRARDRHLEREVAIKVLPFSLAFDAEFVERFQREARTAAKLEHPHIIPIYRVGKTGRVIYFVMKFLRGGALSTLLTQRGTLTPAQIRQILVQAGGALGYAHQHSIVHRDIKPDNIMFDELGHSVLTDFGIAKAATGSRLTGTGMSIGTPHYMSPEQARAQPLDGRSDIYSLGVVAYQCLTGQVPFDGEDAFSIGYKHIMEEVPTPELHTSEERSLMGVIRRMLSKSADERFQDAGELIAAMEGRFRTPQRRATPSTAASEVATSEVPAPPPTTPRSIPADARPSTPTTPIPAAQVKPERRKRSGVLVGMLTMLALGAGGAGGYWYFGMGAQWPLPFLQPQQGLPAESTAVAGEDSLGAAQDSLGIAAADSAGLAAADTGAAGDTAATPVSELPPTGLVVLRGVPPLAQAFVDGDQQEGTTFPVPPGSVRIRVRKTGSEDFDTTVAVARGDTVRVPVTLRPLQVAQAPPSQPQAPAQREPVDYCSQPGAEYNQDGSCFDTEPRGTLVPRVLIPEGVQQRPDPVVLWVKVRADGTAETIQWHRYSNVPQFTRAAGHFALEQMTYQPATKNGRPVDAWLRLTIQPRPR